MRKETIAIDVDDVIAAENEAVRKFVNETYGEKHTAEDYLVDGEYWGYWKAIWGVDKQEAQKRLEAFLASPLKDNLKLMEGVTEAIEKLKKSHELVVVTSRYGRQLKTTEPWLEEHFPKTFSQVAFVAMWSRRKEITKAIICREIGADYLIDDNVGHCELAAEEGINCLLFGDYGWNRSATLTDGITRVRNWQEVLEYFDAKG